MRKLKRKQQNAENKKRKRKEKEAEAAMMLDPSQPAPPAKKRPRKKKSDSLEEDMDAKASHFLQMLGTLPSVPLEEPRVGNFFSVLNVPGSPNVLTGKSCQSYCSKCKLYTKHKDFGLCRGKAFSVKEMFMFYQEKTV